MNSHRWCPKCGKLPDKFWGHWIGHRYSDHIIASCTCGRTWQTKGVQRVVEMVQESLNNEAKRWKDILEEQPNTEEIVTFVAVTGNIYRGVFLRHMKRGLGMFVCGNEHFYHVKYWMRQEFPPTPDTVI